MSEREKKAPMLECKKTANGVAVENVSHCVFRLTEFINA